MCHICGHKVVGLTRHLTHKHRGVTADIYRAYFGLKCTRSLTPLHEQERRRAAAIANNLASYIRTPIPRPSPEQMSVIATRREARIEVAKNRKDRPRRPDGTFDFGRAVDARWGRVMARRPKL